MLNIKTSKIRSSQTKRRIGREASCNMNTDRQYDKNHNGEVCIFNRLYYHLVCKWIINHLIPNYDNVRIDYVIIKINKKLRSQYNINSTLNLLTL